jgi:hypothetical protein
MCALAGLPIARMHDQPQAGCTWRFALHPTRVIENWRPIG